MNLLTHLYLARVSETSAAGQILGDVVKGRLDGRFPASVCHGIALHRAIDRLSDDHELHRRMRRQFSPPLRRYAGIVVDIGFDHSLARAWIDYAPEPLAEFARVAERQVRAEWPQEAPYAADRLAGLAHVLLGYAEQRGVQRALDSVARRLRRRNPVADALPSLLAQRASFDELLPRLLHDLEDRIVSQPTNTAGGDIEPGASG